MTPVRPALRSFLSRRTPRLLGWVRAVRGHWRCGREYRDLQRRIVEALYPDGEIRVMSDLFRSLGWQVLRRERGAEGEGA